MIVHIYCCITLQQCLGSLLKLIISISAVKRGNAMMTQNRIKKDEAVSCYLRSFFFAKWFKKGTFSFTAWILTFGTCGFIGWLDPWVPQSASRTWDQGAHVCMFVQECLLTPFSMGSVLAYLMLLEISVNPFSWVFTTFRKMFCLHTGFHANVSMPHHFNYYWFVIYLVGLISSFFLTRASLTILIF